MYLNSEMNLKSAKIYLDSSNVYLNLRKRMIKFSFSDTFLNADKFLLNLCLSLNLSMFLNLRCNNFKYSFLL